MVKQKLTNLIGIIIGFIVFTLTFAHVKYLLAFLARCPLRNSESAAQLFRLCYGMLRVQVSSSQMGREPRMHECDP